MEWTIFSNNDCREWRGSRHCKIYRRLNNNKQRKLDFWIYGSRCYVYSPYVQYIMQPTIFVRFRSEREVSGILRGSVRTYVRTFSSLAGYELTSPPACMAWPTRVNVPSELVPPSPAKNSSPCGWTKKIRASLVTNPFLFVFLQRHPSVELVDSQWQ